MEDERNIYKIKIEKALMKEQKIKEDSDMFERRFLSALDDKKQLENELKYGYLNQKQDPTPQIN